MTVRHTEDSAPSLDDADKARLLKEARAAREHAYAPYSHFKVGAAVLTGSGEIFTGCNVENAAYSDTLCAERVAIFKAVSEGHRDIKAVAVIADYPQPVPPCGSCRQVMAEFGEHIAVIMGNTAGAVSVEDLSVLLPGRFQSTPSQE